MNLESIKRASLASGLGQYGEAAVQDMKSIFKSPSKKKAPHTRLPSIPNQQMSKTKSARSLSPAMIKQQKAQQAMAGKKYYPQPCSQETKINWVKDVNKFEDKLSPSRVTRDEMGKTLESTGFDIAAFQLAR